MPVGEALGCSRLMPTGGSVATVAKLLGMDFICVTGDIYLECGQQFLLVIGTVVYCASAFSSL